jgi:hypothetical protein
LASTISIIKKFHFDDLYEIYDDGFNNFEPNNSRIWYHVKSIQLKRSIYYDQNFVRELKMKMPNLNLITFDDMDYIKRCSPAISNEQGKIDLGLDKVTTVRFISKSIQDQKEWIIN